MDDFPEGEFLLPLFPLPNLVFFPKTRLPLHVFEPRYRQLVSDAMASEQRMGVVLLKPGWESEYYRAPAIHELGTLGLIEQAVSLNDGRFNILLRGVVRFRVVEPVGSVPYRIARVVAVPEVAAKPEEAYAHREWLVELSRRYLELLPGQMEVPELDTANLDALTNALVMSLNLEMEEKQQLLELDRLADRCERVGELLKKRLEDLQFLAPYRREGDPDKN